jgi:hypothetical protein
MARGDELEGLAVTRPSLEDTYLRLTASDPLTGSDPLAEGDPLAGGDGRTGDDPVAGGES